MKKIMLIYLIFRVAVACCASNGEWKNITPVGMNILSYFCNKDLPGEITVYDGLNIFSSNDYGETWTQTISPYEETNWKFVYHGIWQPGTIVCSTEHSLAVSIDSGNSWEMHSVPFSGRRLVTVNPGSEGVVAALDARTYLSRDNGATWTCLKENQHPENVIRCVWDPVNTSVLYCIGQDFIAWADVNEPVINWNTQTIDELYTYYEFKTSKANGDACFWFSNKDSFLRFRLSDHSVRTIPAFEDGYIGCFIVFDQKPDKIIMQFTFKNETNNTYHTCLTENAGETWILLSKDDESYRRMESCGDHIYIWTSTGVKVSTDDGKNFQPQGKFPGSVPLDDFDQNPFYPEIMQAIIYGNVYKTIDSGENWFMDDSFPNEFRGEKIEYNTCHPGIIYALVRDYSYNNYLVLISVDNGGSWHLYMENLWNYSYFNNLEYNSEIETLFLKNEQVSYEDDYNFPSYIHCDLFSRQDESGYWQSLPEFSNFIPDKFLIMPQDHSAWYAAGSYGPEYTKQGNIFYSTDAGLTWQLKYICDWSGSYGTHNAQLVPDDPDAMMLTGKRVARINLETGTQMLYQESDYPTCLILLDAQGTDYIFHDDRIVRGNPDEPIGIPLGVNAFIGKFVPNVVKGFEENTLFTYGYRGLYRFNFKNAPIPSAPSNFELTPLDRRCLIHWDQDQNTSGVIIKVEYLGSDRIQYVVSQGTSGEFLYNLEDVTDGCQEIAVSIKPYNKYGQAAEFSFIKTTVVHTKGPKIQLAGFGPVAGKPSYPKIEVNAIVYDPLGAERFYRIKIYAGSVDTGLYLYCTGSGSSSDDFSAYISATIYPGEIPPGQYPLQLIPVDTFGNVGQAWPGLDVSMEALP